MPMRRLTMAALVLPAGALAALPAGAADLKGHAIAYQITLAKPSADIAAEGQMSATLSRTCDGWSYSSALFYSIQRRGTAPTSWQEGLKFSEKRNGTGLTYESRYYVNSRGEDVRGTVVLSGDGGGALDAKSERLPRKATLPAGTVLPLALRSQLIDLLATAAPDKARGPFSFRTIEMNRFHTGADLVIVPAAALPALTPPAPRVRSPLLQGRAWTVKQTSKTHSEWLDSTLELVESGVVTRFTFMREGVVWRADVKELTAFTDPKCD